MTQPEMKARVLGCCGAVLLSLSLFAVAGCGPEAAKESPNPTPTAVPGGGSVQDYKGGMQRVLDAQKGGSGGGASTAPGNPMPYGTAPPPSGTGTPR